MNLLLDLSNTVNQIGIYRLIVILKYVLTITLTVVPIIIIITATIDISKVVFKPDASATKESLKKILNRILAGLAVFLIPSILSFCFSLIEEFDDTTIISYYNSATIEKVKELEEQYKVEKAAADAISKAEQKEAYAKLYEEEKKKNEQLEEIMDKYRDDNSPGSYDGDSISSGEFGSVKVENGVFYIPNQRATSDSDIPKQSGEYGLNPIFWERLSSLINDAAEKGYKVSVTSGWRSYSSQKNLWDSSSRPCSERGRWTACPGGSRHGFGIAADLSFNGTGCSGGWDCNAAAKWVHENAANYGLKFRMSWEPWHIEPEQISGGNFGSCQATC